MRTRQSRVWVIGFCAADKSLGCRSRARARRHCRTRSRAGSSTLRQTTMQIAAALRASDRVRKKPLEISSDVPIFRVAQIARACGRVSRGGDPDKRPVNRQLKDRQPEANRQTPPNGGRDLKQRRTGLFRLCQFPNLAYRRGLSFLPGVRNGTIPFQAKAMMQLAAKCRPKPHVLTAQHLIAGDPRATSPRRAGDRDMAADECDGVSTTLAQLEIAIHPEA